MSRISERIREILGYGKSVKVTDQKKCVSELLKIYENEDALKVICQHTEERTCNTVNWYYIMHIAHQLALNEADREPSKETISSVKNNERQAVISLIINTIRQCCEKSIRFVKSNKIVPLLLQILDSEYYAHYQDTYLGILVKYILPKNVNNSDITTKQWRELLVVCKKLYKSVHLKKHIVLNALQMIVEYSFPHANLLADVKDSLLFLEDIFEDVKTNDEQLIESFYKLANSVCRQIATESRITLCKFSEAILMDILHLNGSEEKYRLLLVFLQIHHPEGISKYDDGAYAYDWSEWNDLLGRMYLLVQENCKLDIQWQGFVQFASEVVKQMIDNIGSIVCSLDTNYNGSYFQSTKRRRRSKVENIAELIIESSPEEVWSWIKISTETLKKYPQCLKSQDLAPLLQYVIELAQSLSRTTDSTESVMNCLYKLSVVLMENEMSIGEVQDATIHWSKIWDMLLRSLGANQNEESANILVRCFIRHNRMPNANTLLRLYLTKTIRWSPKNVRTLLLLCRRVSLPEDATASVLDSSLSSTPICDRTCLLQWLLNVPWQKLVSRLLIDDICFLCVDLILSSRCRQNIRVDILPDLEDLKCSQNHEVARKVISVPWDFHSTNLSQFCYSSLALKPDLLVYTKDEHAETNSRTIPGPISYVEETLNFLKHRLYDFLQEEINDEVYVVLIKLALLARLLSILMQLGVLTDDVTNNSLIVTLEKYLTSSFEILANIKSNCKSLYLLSVIKALNVLYRSTYNTNIAKIIVSASTVKMLRNIFDLLNVDDTNMIDYRRGSNYYEEPTYYERRRRFVASLQTPSTSFGPPHEGMIRLCVIETLASFCALHIGTDKSVLQTKTIKNLLEQESCTSYMDLRISLTILESFAEHDQNEFQREHANALLEFLLKVCQEDFKDQESLCRLLSLLPFFFEYAMKYHYSSRKVIEQLSAFYKRIHEQNYGVPVHVDYMGCVCGIIRIDPNFSWTVDASNEITMILNSVLEYINYPFFVLRAQAVRCLQELLSFRNVAYMWKEWMFVKVEETVLKLLNNEQSNSDSQSLLQTCQEEDEKETRVATSLTALASVACANGVLQGRALSSMLQLTVKREVQAQKVQKILSVAMRQTMYTSLYEDNLKYLLTSWLDVKYSLQKFPWTLEGCEIAAEFFKKHINHIVPLLLRTSSLSEAISFCTSVDVAFADVFEETFPSCVIWLISRVCDRTSVDNVAMQMLQELQMNIKEFVSMRDFTQLLIDRLKDVIVELMQRLHDEEHFKHLFSFSAAYFPDDPPHFSATTMDRCFSYLEKNYLMKPLTHVLVEQQPATLQKTLLQLVSAVHSSHFNEGKLKRLHQYAYFCCKLMRDLGESYFDNMAAFLVRDICYSLLHLTGSDGTLSTACCKFLDLFLRQALPTRAAEVQDVFRFIVANLIGLAQSASSVEVTLNLLRFLIVEQRDILRESIAKLSSFPNLEIFQEVREVHKAVRYVDGAVRLEEELERFLDAMSDENAECTLEDLANLTQQLSTRKKELKELHRKLERSYSEDGVSILHQVIFKLMKLAESPNARISIEATRCLGELGPTDSTVALRPSESLVHEADHVIEALTYRSVTMLTSFLVESAVNLRKASADALYMVFSTTYGQKLSNPEYMQDLLNIHNICAPLKIDYIQPFIQCRVVAEKSFSVNFAKFRTIMNSKNEELWIIKNGENYAEWIVKITCSIAECFADSYLESFLPVCLLSVKFCELILPRIIFLITQRCESSFSALCNCVNQFFRYHFAIDQEVEVATSSTSLVRDSCDRNIVRRMLDVVNYVRTQLLDNVTLKLDYIYLARAAHECSAYYTALLFVQLACESFCTDYPNFSSDPKIDYIYEHHPQFGRVLQDIMQDTYLNISDSDAICGAGSSYLVDHNSRVQYYARTNSWNKVMLMQDIELSYSNCPLAAREMSNALHRSGLLSLQWKFLSKTVGETTKLDYECAWRLSNWDLLDNDTATSYNDSTLSRLESLENSFHQHHYRALKYFHDNDHRGTEKALECARKSVINSLKVISLESSRTVNEKLSQLRLLREIEQLSLIDSQKYSEVLQRWNEHEILTGQFEYVEPILQQRIIMFRIKEPLKTDMNMQEAFFTTCLDLAMIAENQGNFPIADRALGTLAKHQDLSEDLQNQLLYQQSLLTWMTRDNKVARRLLRNLIEKRNMKPSLRAKALRVYGDWMAETKSENPQAVIQKYYLESIKTSNAIDDDQTPDVIKNLNDTQVALARFADAQYEQMSEYMKSPTYESLKECARIAIKVDTAQAMTNDLIRAVIISQKQSRNDAAELENIAQEKRNYLFQALKYYFKTLRYSEEHNLLIFRLVSLWLDNMLDVEVNEFMSELENIPSFKFVPLVPQLAAHISNDLKNSFSARIFDILWRCALEHPYHTLPVVLALKNLHNDNEFDANMVTKKEERRVLGAKKLLKKLADSLVSTTIDEMETLSSALVSLAYWKLNIDNIKSGKRYQIPQDQPIFKIKNLDNVLLPTLNLPVKPSGNYKNVIGVKSYHKTCEFVGGVNAPKKIICVGTDGKERRQLVKGKDDLRQDAVMQQVFTVMNTLLRTCKETKQRNLRIRTYKVVPLTQRSGVLEWCDNTLPIAMTLTGNADTPGLHRKYYPRDITAETARNKLRKVAEESNEMKLKVFLNCCKRMRPAFQHFFEEKYLSPQTWVERTLTYIRSVATTSIAGYILGLGDRHLSNILIDEQTAEVVHIDFGIAFEQGKVLPIPETIPFRLTRDIEVAMGASGIEGTMRRSCEVTMTMLRDQKQIIITLLQVLLYDPLFTWAITPEKACKMQKDIVKGFSERRRAPVETNKIAQRALLRIEQKLQGTEDGLVSSVSGQVERLLQEARDPAKLCRVYSGWQPYL